MTSGASTGGSAGSRPPTPPEVSIVVPVYRSGAVLEVLRARIHAAMASAGLSYELILVEDDGGDDSWRVVADLAARHVEVRGVKLSRNFGQHAATLCGISRATGEWVVTIDDDLEQPPEMIPALVAKGKEGYALVYGTLEERKHAPWRNLTSEVGRSLFKFAIPSLNRDYTSFRAIHRSAANALERFQSPFTFIDGYLSWITSNYATVTVPHNERATGRSNYNLRKLISHMINIFVTFSDLPLRLATWLGIGSSLGGAIWGAIIIGGRLTGTIGVSGYASLMAAIMFIGGIQLLILGIFGEYLARINFRTGSMPVFLVDRECS